MTERCLRRDDYCFYESDWGPWDRAHLRLYTEVWGYELIE